MSWALTAGRRLMGRNSPRQNPLHHHHFHHRGVLSSGGACSNLRRGRYLVVAMLVLAGVLLVNMLLLVPSLHADGPASSSSSGGGSTGWHLKGVPAAGPAAAVGPAAAPGRAKVGEQQQQQQQGTKQPPKGDFMQDFDANRDGVLGPAEFQTLLQEACRNDRSSLGVFSWSIRMLRLSLGLRPHYAPAGPYPCSLRGELADATRQAAAALGRSSDSSSGSSSSKSQGRGSKGLRDEVRADTAAGAAAVDPDSPEGQAAARRASLLARCSSLTTDLAAAAASHGTLLLVAADWGMFELFGVNWLTHVQRSGLDNYLMVALDQKTSNFLTNNKLGHCVNWNPSLAGGGEGVLPSYSPPAASPGSKQHAVLSWSVLQVAEVLLGWEYDIIISHLDTVWLTDPLPYLQAHVPAAADVVLSTEAPASAAVMSSRSAGLMSPPDPQGHVSMGVAYIRGTLQGQAAVAAWLAEYEVQLAEADAAAAAEGGHAVGSTVQLPVEVVDAWLSGVGSRTGRHQQGVMVQGPHPSEPNSLLLVGPSPGWWGSLFGTSRRLSQSAGVGVFSPVAVSNSYSWFVQGVGWRAAAVVARSSSSAASGRKLPLAVHVGGGHSTREGRLHQLREAQWYADGPKYYSDPKLLSFDLKLYSSPQVTAGLANAPDFSQGELLALHLASLSHQLQQFYAGAAVAATLDRVLVLPTFQCYCYRDTGSGSADLSWLGSGAHGKGWACRAPGDDNSVLPFNCTVDQVMDPAVLYAHRPAVAGHAVLFRESPFLQNPRSPSWIRHAATTISSGAPIGCPEGGAPCAQVLQSRPPTGVNQQVVVPPSLTDATLTTVLAQFSAAKWLHFTDITAVFGGFANPAHKTEFEAWLDKVVLPWCCKPVGDDGGGSVSHSGESAMDGVALDAAGAAAGADSFPLQGISEVPTSVPGWVAVEVKARPGKPLA